MKATTNLVGCLLDFLDKKLYLYPMKSPQQYITKFLSGYCSLERPDFHPEQLLGRHIVLVVMNAIATGDKNIFVAALLHDICKPQGAKLVDKGEFVYYSNPFHDKQAYDLIMGNAEIQQWIISMGADVQIVADICKYHMREKNYMNMRPHKQKNYLAETTHIRKELELFSECDKMI